MEQPHTTDFTLFSAEILIMIFYLGASKKFKNNTHIGLALARECLQLVSERGVLSNNKSKYTVSVSVKQRFC